MFERSLHAWKEALATSPAENASQQDTQLIAQYEEGVRLAEEGLNGTSRRTTLQSRLVPLPGDLDVKLPWIRALELEDVLTANNVLNTCVSPNLLSLTQESLND